METNATTIRQLREQEQTLGAQITQLEATAEASAPGIREFRRTRLRQLTDQRFALSERVRRMESAAGSAVDAYILGAALRDANLVARGTFGA